MTNSTPKDRCRLFPGTSFSLKNPAGRSTTTQMACEIQNLFIFREPIVTLYQLVTLAQFGEIRQWTLGEPMVTVDW